MIYLDNAATTFPKSQTVYETMDYVNRNLAVNAGRGSYEAARKASELISNTKSKILNLVNGLDCAKLVFTPSATIALNQVLQGLSLNKNDFVYVSPYEHNAVARTIHLIARRKGIQVRELPIDSVTLEIDMDKVRYLFTKEPPACVCCTHISNVTGYILPIQQIFKLAKEFSSVTVLDGAQSLGLIPVDIKQLSADFIVFAGHKALYGPFGIAGIIDYSNIVLDDSIVGGTGSDSLNLSMPNKSPEKYEAASHNITAIAGLSAALDEVEGNLSIESHLTKYLINKISGIDRIIVYLPQNIEDNHISIVSFNIKGFKAEDVGIILDEDFDIAVRTGYHCAPYIHKYLKDSEYLGTVRVGIGRYNNENDIDKLVEALLEILQ